MNNQDIYEKVEEFVKDNLGNTPFDKALPKLQDYVWELADMNGTTGPEILSIYFDIKSKK